MANTTEGIQMRYNRKSYYNVGAAEPADFALLGLGFTDFTFNNEAQEYSRKYVIDIAERTSVIGYAPSIDFTADVYSNDPVVMDIFKIGNDELTGADAERDVVTYDEFLPSGSAGAFEAIKRRYSIMVSSIAPGTDSLQISGTFSSTSDIIKGVFNPSTGEFTANT